MGRDARFEAVLFDLDGTLIDTVPLILACFHRVLEVHRGQRLPDQVFLRGLGTSLIEQLRALARDEPEAQAMRRTYMEYNRGHHDRLARPFAGVDRLVRELRARGYALGVVTSKSHEMSRRGLSLFGLAQYFPVLVGLEDTPRHKPDPMPLVLGAERLGVRVDQALYVGDAPADAQAAAAAGMPFAAALWGEPTLLDGDHPALFRARAPAELLERL